MALQMWFHSHFYQDPVRPSISNQYFHWFSMTVFYSQSGSRNCSYECIFKVPRFTQFVHSCSLLVWKLHLLRLLFTADCSEDHSDLPPTCHMLQQGIPMNRMDRQWKLRIEVGFFLRPVISHMNDHTD